MFRLVSFTSLVLFSSSHYLKLRGFSNGLVRKDYNQREREGGGRELREGLREGERKGGNSGKEEGGEDGSHIYYFSFQR